MTGKFQKGRSGNPKGKTKGTKNKATLTAEQLLQGELNNICLKLVEEACKGNIQAIKLVLERLLPPKKNRDIEINLPILQTSSDALKAIATIITEVSHGNITPNEGEDLSKIIDSFIKASEAYDLEKRITVLEKEIKNND